MHCPQCKSAEFDLTVPCPDCEFNGDGHSLERLSNVNYLLNEMPTWGIARVLISPIEKRYQKQRRTIEIEIGLRPPPPNEAETHDLRLQAAKREYLRKKLSLWADKGWISSGVWVNILGEIDAEIAQIEERLIDAPIVRLPASLTKQALRQWELAQYAKQTLERLYENEQIHAYAYRIAMAQLTAEIEQLELAAGLRRREPDPAEAREEAAAETVAAPSPPRRKREPITWDKVWESLLSERTLHAILFLGVVLLFASGVSWVAWNWETFPPIVQIAVLGGYTIFFYGLGWYVRVKMKLRGSGVALSAVASLLLPLDFYAFYLSGGFPPESWPSVWLLTSVVCLFAYTLTAVIIQAPFFGYLVGLALSSLFAAGLNVAGAAFHWQLAGISAAALLQAILSDGLRRRKSKAHILAVPFGQMALATAVPLMAITLIWGFFSGNAGFSFQMARAASWLFGSVTLALMTRHYRLRPFVLITALAIPITLWLTQGSFFILWETDAGWHAPGWALLAALYLIVGRRWDSRSENASAFLRIILAVGWLLIAVSALWALMDAPAASMTYFLLAGVMVLVARLWRDARPLWLMSLFLLIGSGSGMAWREASPAELALPWSLLAILHIVAALRLSAFAGKQPAKEWELNNPMDFNLSFPRRRESTRLKRWIPASAGMTSSGFNKIPVPKAPTPAPNYAAPLFGASVLIAGAALLPPAIFFDQTLLIYALGNWIGVNGWLAWLAHRQETPALQTLLAHPRLQPIAPTLFQWLTALPLVGWIWLFWDNGGFDLSSLALLYALLAWALLGLCLRLRRARWVYGRPWQTIAHLSNAAALAIIVTGSGQPWTTAVLWLTAVFYFFAVLLLHNRRWFYAGGLLLPFALISSLDRLGVDEQFWNLALASIPLLYMTAVIWLEDRHNQPPAFTRPLIRVAFLLTAVNLLIAVGETLFMSYSASAGQEALAATAPLLVAATFALYAWQRGKTRWAHVAIWLATAALGVIAAAYSRGSGRSAALAALLAIIYVLAERVLRQLALAAPIAGWRAPKRTRPSLRRAWRLFRQPLLIAGWAVSAIAIGMALGRNLFVLGGGTMRELWSIIALSLLTAWYALSARLFREEIFVWIASVTAIAPWTLAAHFIYNENWEWAGAAWAALALALLATGIGLAKRLGLGRWSWPPLVVAHIVMAAALIWGTLFTAVSVVSVPLAILFYLAAAWIDRRFRAKGAVANPRFLYPMAALMPVWAVYLLLEFAPRSPTPTLTPIGLLVVAFALPMLLVGRRLARWEAGYGLPFYLTAYATAIIAMPLVSENLPVLAGVLFFNTALALLSVWLFRQPLWFYPATVLLPTAVTIVLIHNNAPDPHDYGWALIGLAAVYLAGARALRQFSLRHYETPLLAMMFVLIAVGLPLSSFDRVGVLVGYGAAVATLTFAAVWLRKPFVLSLAVGLATAPYWAAVSLLNIDTDNYGLIVWPGILLTLFLGRWLDRAWGMEPTAGGQKSPIARFPWGNLGDWPTAFWQRWSRWWPFSLYATALWWTAVSALFAIESPWRWTLVLAWGTIVYLMATARFRSKGWLLIAGAWAQFTALALIRWTWPGWDNEPAWLALAFMPVTALTLLAALTVERTQGEGALLTKVNGRWRLNLEGWSRPFLLLFLIDLCFGQMMTLAVSGASASVTLLHGIMIGVLATVWGLPLLAYPAAALGVIAAAQWLQFWDAPTTIWPPALALLATIYGAVGYWLRRGRLKRTAAGTWAKVWERPLIHSGWILSFLTVGLLFIVGNRLPQAIIAAAFWGRLPLLGANLQAVMAIRTFAILGLFYLAAALVESRPRLGYLALALLFAAWSLWLLLIQNAHELQLYALPAGLYLLAVGWMEWTYGRRGLARWIDGAAILLLFGSVFWQSFGAYGEWYALLMVVEGLLIGWMGSWRRLRRLLYAGVAGVVTAVGGQLIEPLFALNTFALLLLGAALVAVGIGLERRLETVRELSKEFRLKLEEWE